MSITGNQAISRREFVGQSGLLAGAALLGTSCLSGVAAGQGVNQLPSPVPNGPPRRILGRTNVPISMFTMGTAPCGSLPPREIARLVNVALDAGVNAVDTSEKYTNAQEGVGLALGKRRKDVFLSTKVFANTIAEAEQSLAKSIKLLKTDRFDLLYYHSVGDLKIDRARESDGVFTWLIKQKQAGTCRFLGISGHNLPARFPQFLQTGEVDVLMVAMNFVDRHTYNFEETVLPVARKHGVAIVAMKVFGGAAGGNYTSPKGAHIGAQYVSSALRYALGIPGVVSANLGVQNPAQIRDNVRMVRDFRPLSPEEHSKLMNLGKGLAVKWGKHFGPATEEKKA
jgi:uncharacterized protein